MIARACLVSVVVLCLVNSASAYAELVERHRGEPQPWMRKDNPEMLSVITEVSPTCPDPAATYVDILRNILRRAGIRSTKAPLARHDPYVKLEITCGQADRMHYMANITARFWAVRPGRTTHSTDAGALYGQLHRDTEREEIRRAVKEVFEQVVADYRKANAMR